MEYPVPAYTSFTIPTGATTGQRITFNENGDGVIRVYNSIGQLVDTIGGATGDIISYAVGLTQSIALSQGELVIGDPSSNFVDAATITGLLSSGGSIAVSTGIGDLNHIDAVNLVMYAGKDNQTTGSSTAPHVELFDGNTDSPVDQWITGSVIKSVVGGSPYTWQTPSYNANWLASTTFNGNVYKELLYRLDAENNLHISGCFKAGAIAPGNPVFTLPVGYRPAGAHALWAMRNNGGVTTSGHIFVGGSGQFNVIAALGIAANNEYVCEGIIPLQQIP